MYSSTATVWKDEKDSYKVMYLSGIHVEESFGESDSSGISGIGGNGLKLFVNRETPLQLGDYVCAGIVTEAEPPTNALKIHSINRYSLNRGLHHIEVSAR